MSTLDEVDDEGLRTALATQITVGIGTPDALSRRKCCYAVQWTGACFRVFRHDESLAAVVASYTAVCEASHRLLAELGVQA